MAAKSKRKSARSRSTKRKPTTRKASYAKKSAQKTTAKKTATAKTALGLGENIEGLLAYLLGFVTGIIFLIIEKNRFVRFHAMQSTVTFLSIVVLQWIIGALAVGLIAYPLMIVNWLLSLIAFILWIVGMLKAYQGEMYKFPICGNIAESLLK